jgi:hypothetical protein
VCGAEPLPLRLRHARRPLSSETHRRHCVGRRPRVIRSHRSPWPLEWSASACGVSRSRPADNSGPHHHRRHQGDPGQLQGEGVGDDEIAGDDRRAHAGTSVSQVVIGGAPAQHLNLPERRGCVNRSMRTTARGRRNWPRPWWHPGSRTCVSVSSRHRDIVPLVEQEGTSMTKTQPLPRILRV